MSIDVDRDLLSTLMLLGAAFGFTLGVIGMVKSRTQSLLLGVTLLFYSFTGLTYVPLMGDPPQALDLMSRMWGAMTAVIAGACLMGVVSGTRGMGVDSPTESRSRWTIMLSMFAAISLAAVYYALNSYADLPPSSDFLNEYGHLVGVFLYQLIFALWITGPVTFLGWSMAQSSSLGRGRWLIAAGGVSSAAWGIWKVLGACVALGGGTLPAASPASVTLGLSTLVLCVTGFAVIAGKEMCSERRESAEYRRAREAEDATFRSAGIDED